MGKNIIIFSLASVALHAGLLMIMPSSEPVPLAGSPFNISIFAASEQVAKPVQEKEHAEDQVEQDLHTHTPEITSRSSSKVVVKQPLHENLDQSEASSAPVNQSAHPYEIKPGTQTASKVSSVAIKLRQASLLRNELHQAFRLQFYYPRLAVKRGWQGEVRLGLKIAANGMLEDIRIMHSSGYSVLDRAALESMAKVEHLPAAGTLLNGQSLALELPVQYRLL